MSAACVADRAPVALATGAPLAHGGLQRFAIDAGQHTGLSDLTIDRDGHFWSVPERQRVLLRLHLTGGHPGVDDAEIPLDGVAEGLDTESLAYLAPGHFALGTEAQADDRPSDDILLVTVAGGRARVTERVQIPYRLWQVGAHRNDGLEGLCAAAGVLLASCETAGHTADGRRFAPLGRLDLATRQWTPFRLLLTSQVGKISGLACRVQSSGQVLEVLAIERHIGVSRLLRVEVPLTGPGTALHPEIWADFGRELDAVPNLEGVAFGPEGDLFVLSDNDFGIVTGPTQMVHLPRGWRGGGAD